MIDFFNCLGGEIARHWAAWQFDTLALPDIAAAALAKAKPSDHVTFDSIAGWLAEAESIPPQPNIDSTFGQPPITMFWHPRFFIEVLHWTAGTTLIHQHGFSGAFCVVAGSSLQSVYTFRPRRRVNTHMLLGELVLDDVSLLRVGDIRRIRSGASLIHSVFHLDHPSVTLVVRTHTDVESKPQYNYHPPALAIDPLCADPLLLRRVQAIEFMRRTGSKRFDEAVRIGLSRSDLCGVYKLLGTLATLCDSQAMTRFVDIALSEHGSDVYRLWACIEEAKRQSVLIQAREHIAAAGPRFLLALLLNVRSRERMVSLVRHHAPKREPYEQLLEWCTMLSKREVGVEMDELNRALFAALMTGVASETAVDGLRETFSPDDVGSRRQELVEHCRTLRQDSVFRYLLAESESAGASTGTAPKGGTTHRHSVSEGAAGRV